MFGNLRNLMRARRICLFHLAGVLRMSDSSVCERLAGRIPLAPHEKQRLAEFFGVKQEWLFAPLDIPASARLKPETAMLAPATERR